MHDVTTENGTIKNDDTEMENFVSSEDKNNEQSMDNDTVIPGIWDCHIFYMDRSQALTPRLHEIRTYQTALLLLGAVLFGIVVTLMIFSDMVIVPLGGKE